MNLWNGKVKNYNNKILISSPSFNIGTNLKVNLDGEKDKSDVKPKKVEIIKTKSDFKPKKEPEIKSSKEPDMNGIIHEEEKAALILGITSIFTVWWLFKLSISFSFLS